jgi:hypothetical protein
MTWAMSSGVRSSITRIAVAGVLIAIPTAGVSVPVHATPGFGGTSNMPAPYGVHPAQPPAAPSTDEPEPTPPPPPSTQPPVGAGAGYDWGYGTDASGGGGGGGG